jgi:hypothetical protein
MTSMPDLHNLIGSDIVFMLRLVQGPVQGMNIRNLLWHGFFGDNEFQKCYASLMMMLIVSLADIPAVMTVRFRFSCTDQNKAVTKGRRTLLNMSKFDKPVDVPSFNIETLVDSSYIVPTSQRKLWKKAMQYYYSGHHYYCIALLFPLMENALRRLYGVVNNCEDVVMSAERNVTYVTFEHVLTPQLNERTDKNFIFDELSPTLLQ